MGVSENAIVSNVSLTLVDEQPLPPSLPLSNANSRQIFIYSP